jgi:cytochrome c oxidase cbb3-type subunit 2
MVEGGPQVKWLGVRAALAVAAVYGYFLIFAQFALVELLRAAGTSLTAEKSALGAMALAGIAGGFSAAWRGVSPNMVKSALGVAALTAALAPVAHALPLALGVVAAVTGAALGVATVGLAALLPGWCGVTWVGLGTGLAYACCNLPPVFQQSPSGQAWIGAGFALAGVWVVPATAGWKARITPTIFPLGGAVAIFTALVWLDSAAFFIIQHAPELKSATWGAAMLWRNAAVHLVVAGVAGLWLADRGARVVPLAACGVLAVAALAVNAAATRGLAGWVYPIGVSLYSTALVAWPGWFCGVAGVRAAAWRAAWLFAIAGWVGSVNGIGMAQSLHRVPPVFVALAGGVVLGVIILSDRRLWRPALAVCGVLWLAMICRGKDPPPAAAAMDRGRQVYVAEGCIHCHSQYVRPGSPDETIWGPPRAVAEVMAGEPVLIGNRRQGPDLTNVGARRSEAWLKLHFLKPQALVVRSTMPSYAHLFQDGRGDDLVKYLKQSGVGATGSVIAQAARWQPAGTKDGFDGKALFAANCAACHGEQGMGNGPLAGNFAKPPANLTKGPFLWTAPGAPLEPRVARIVKFGLPGTDMPGHETLGDGEVRALAQRVLELRE